MKNTLQLLMRLFFLLSCLLVAAWGDQPHAATFIVNSSYDVHDLNLGDGSCVAYLIIQPPFVFPSCTLRAAIEEANSLPGPDTVILPDGTYFLALAGAGEDASRSGDLDITDSLVLVGGGPGKTVINGMQLDRVLDIVESDISVAVSGITITNGLVPAYLPAGQKTGGGIRNAGTLLLKNSSLEDNSVPGQTVGNMGGGLDNQNRSTIKNSTMLGNSARYGGAVANAPGAVLRISASTMYRNRAVSGGGMINLGSINAVNVTMSGNTAATGTGGIGGAVQNWSEASLVHCTIAGNEAAAGGGVSNDGRLAMMNTIVADNQGGNCRLGESIDSRGHNLAGDGSCGLDRDRGDIEGVNPHLETLRDNGGDTLTQALGQNSPAIDTGVLMAAVPADQRGVRRPQRTNADIGAYELTPVYIAPLLEPLLLKQSPP